MRTNAIGRNIDNIIRDFGFWMEKRRMKRKSFSLVKVTAHHVERTNEKELFILSGVIWLF